MYKKSTFLCIAFIILSRYYGLPLKSDTDDSAENLLKKTAESVDRLNVSSIGTSEYVFMYLRVVYDVFMFLMLRISFFLY